MIIRAIIDLPFVKSVELSRDNLSEETQQYCYKKMPRGLLMFAKRDWEYDGEFDE